MQFMKKSSVSAVAIAITFCTSLAFASEHANLAVECKTECPEAKSDHEAHECVEKLETSGDANFKQSKCYKAHLQHEKAEKTKKHKGKKHRHKHKGEKEDGHSEDGHAH